jgi:hypothetical protein
MSTIVTRAGKGSALSWAEADANITNLNTDKLESIVADLTPRLGADLDVNGHDIISLSNGNINLAPHGTGVVVADGVKISNGSVTTNVSLGNGSLFNNTVNGLGNTALGYYTLYTNTTGDFSTAVGTEALFTNSTSNNNTAVGYRALYLATGSNNIAIGTNAANAITTGSNNTIIGQFTGTTTLSDTVVITAGTTERLKINSSGLYINGSEFTGGGGSSSSGFDQTFLLMGA